MVDNKSPWGLSLLFIQFSADGYVGSLHFCLICWDTFLYLVLDAHAEAVPHLSLLGSWHWRPEPLRLFCTFIRNPWVLVSHVAVRFKYSALDPDESYGNCICSSELSKLSDGKLISFSPTPPYPSHFLLPPLSSCFPPPLWCEISNPGPPTCQATAPPRWLKPCPLEFSHPGR